MPLFSITIRELGDDGKEIDGHDAHSVMSETEIKDHIGWLIKLAKTGELNVTRPEDELKA